MSNKEDNQPISGSLEEIAKSRETKIEVRGRSETILSKKEKTLIEKMTKKKIESQNTAKKKLIWVSIICVFFMIVEVVGGIISGSLAIMSDAAHMFSDFSGFAISMVAIYLSAKPPTKTLSYGYYRCEVIGAVVSVLSIWGITAWLVYESVLKVKDPELIKIESNIMIIVAVIGFICNLLMGHVLHSSGGHHHHGIGGECPHSKKEDENDLLEDDEAHDHDHDNHKEHDNDHHGHDHDHKEECHGHDSDDHIHSNQSHIAIDVKFYF